MKRARELTPQERLAIRKARELRQALEAIRADLAAGRLPELDRDDADAVQEAIGWLCQIDDCLADLGTPPCID